MIDLPLTELTVFDPAFDMSSGQRGYLRGLCVLERLQGAGERNDLEKE